MGFAFNDLKPALRVIDIIDVIAQDPTIGLKFSDDFFKETGMFGDLYMWLHRNKGEIGITPSNESNVSNIILNKIQSFTATQGTVVQFFQILPTTNFPPTFDGGIFRFRTQRLESSIGVIETMQISWKITPQTSSKKFTAKLRRAGTGEIITAATYQQTGFIRLQHSFEGDSNFTEPLTQHNVEFVIETTETSLNLTYELTFTRETSGHTTSADNFTATVQAGIVEPDSLVETIFVQNNIPDISILEFLTGLFRTFNLTAFIESDLASDDYGDVVVKTLDSFYAGGTNRDITEFVDVTQT